MNDAPARLLRLLSLLQDGREWTGADLATRLEVSGRTVRRDIERLRALGYPVEGTLGPVGGYRLAAGTAMPPLLLDDDEATAVTLGLRTVVAQPVAGMDEASVRALAKLQQVLPVRLRARVNSLAAATVAVPRDRVDVDPQVLMAIGRAVSSGQRLRFDYRTAEGRPSLRLVEPRGLVATGRRWYLVAFDIDRDDWRIFRVDRVRDPRPLATSDARRALPATDTAAFVQDKLYTLAPTHEAVATVGLSLGAATHRLGDLGAELTMVDDDRTRVRLASDTIEWLAIRLLLLDCDFSVEEPPALVSYFETLALRLRRGTGHTEGVADGS